MFLEEKVINGILHWRGHPDHEFVAYTAEELTRMVESLWERIPKSELHG